MSIYKKFLAALITLFLFIGGTTWLIGPHINQTLLRGPNLVSEYESIGAPYSEWFRLFDGLAALLLFSILIYRSKIIQKNYSKLIYRLLLAVPLLQIFDILIPIKCSIVNKVCIPEYNIFAYLHGIESYILGAITFVIAILIARKNSSKLWIPLSIAGLAIIGLIFNKYLHNALFGVQAVSVILNIYIYWYISMGDVFERENFIKNHYRVTKIASLILASLVLMLFFDTALHLTALSKISSSLIFGSNAIVIQHIVLSSLILLYLSRALWAGSHRAWQIATVIVWFQIGWLAVFGNSYFKIFVYLLLLCLLIMTKTSFKLMHNINPFKQRLYWTFGVLTLTTLAVLIFSVSFRHFSINEWQNSSFTPIKVIERVLLIEVSSSPSDPLKARLFGQTLTVFGVIMYLWLFTSLFAPYAINDRKLNTKAVLRLLEKYSSNPEDYFKLWPKDKFAYFCKYIEGAIIYKQQGSYVFALANPLCDKKHYTQAISEFNDFCKSYGTKVCWVLVDEKDVGYYKKNQLEILGIGASAVVSIDSFSETTVKNKWWRWKINKSKKNNLEYKKLAAPQSPETLKSLRAITRKWLEKDGRKERTFLLGYHNDSVLQKQDIHVLVNSDNKIVAFANQLPTYNNNNMLTIDLMRSQPEYSEAMASLLANIIIESDREQYRYFDLGFVPLAMTGESQLGKRGIAYIQNAITPLFSARGLVQFKNKFDPQWTKKYIAYEGDVLDIIPMINALQKAITKQ